MKKYFLCLNLSAIDYDYFLLSYVKFSSLILVVVQMMVVGTQ